MKVFLEPNHTVEDEASVCATLRADGNGCRATALPKVLKLFQGAHHVSNVSILENPEISSKMLILFQGAHPK